MSIHDSNCTENCTLRIDNSGPSVNCAIGHISETIKGIIKCNRSNGWAYFSLSFDIRDIHIILDSLNLLILNLF